MRSNQFPLAVVCVIAVLWLPMAAWAQDPANPPNGQPVQNAGTDILADIERGKALITVNWKNEPLSEALKLLSRKSGVDIILDKGIEAMVTRDFQNQSWHNVLEVLVRDTECVMIEKTPTWIQVGKPPRVTMTFSKAPLDKAVEAIAKIAGLSIVVSPNVTGQVSFSLTNIPWRDALESVVKTAGNFVVVEEANNVIRVILRSDLQTQLETRMFKLMYLRPPDYYRPKIITPYSTGGPKDIADPVAEFGILQALRGSLSTDAGGKALGSLTYDKGSHTIIVKDTKPALEQIARMIKQLDIPSDQVLIEVRFISTRNSELAQMGISYARGGTQGFSMSTIPAPPEKLYHGGEFGNVTQTPGIGATGWNTASPGGAPGKVTDFPFGIGNVRASGQQWFLTAYDVTATLRLFQQDTQSTVLQAPQIILLDNQEATIFVGETIRYAEIQSQSDSTGNVTVTVKEAANSPVKIGFQLLVIPHIIKDINSVVMQVIPQNEVLSGSGARPNVAVDGFERFSVGTGVGGAASAFIDLPRVQTSTVITRMMLESGQTGILGGLVQDRDTKTLQKIPFLGDIPILGWLFKDKAETVVRENLIIFITPRIIKGSKESAEKIQTQLDSRNDANLAAWEGSKNGEAQQTLEQQLEARRKAAEAEYEKIRKGDETPAEPAK